MEGGRGDGSGPPFPLRWLRYAAAMRRTPILAALVLMAACSDETRTAGGVTKAEAEALDEAAEIIEQQRLPAEAVQPGEAKAADALATDPTKSGG